MNTREEASKAISSFLDSDERVMLLTGTHQHEKHVLALTVVLTEFTAPATVLFRANSVPNAEQFLSRVVDLKSPPKTGIPLGIAGGYKLFVDSIRPTSWKASPSRVDVGVTYPIESLNADEGDECYHDLVSRKCKKIILVSCTDSRDFFWTEHLEPKRVVFDAEEENPEQHKGVLQSIEKMTYRNDISGLPEYAQSTPPQFLVQLHCDNCRSGRWAKLNEHYPGKITLRDADYGVYVAKCLKCGYEARDNYNWYGQHTD
ncbi:MAG: hypothetical protein Q8Q12_08875 [bacterium]|nr:hypothetical protein [bacterium]